MPLIKSLNPTAVGATSILLWSSSTLLLTELSNVPLLLQLSICLTVALALSLANFVRTNGWKALKQPWYIFLFGTIGIWGNDVAFYAAVKHAPPAQVVLLCALWIPLVVLLSSWILKEPLSKRYLFACLLGLGGIYLVTNDPSLGLSLQYWLGYLLAVLGAFIWAVYVVTSRFFKHIPHSLVGIYCGIGAAISFVAHRMTEPAYVPTFYELKIMVLVGLTSSGLAFFLWDYGVKQGNYRFLSLLSNFIPILAVCWLVLSHKAPLTWPLITGSALVLMSLLIVTNFGRVKTSEET